MASLHRAILRELARKRIEAEGQRVHKGGRYHCDNRGNSAPIWGVRYSPPYDHRTNQITPKLILAQAAKGPKAREPRTQREKGDDNA